MVLITSTDANNWKVFSPCKWVSEAPNIPSMAGFWLSTGPQQSGRGQGCEMVSLGICWLNATIHSSPIKKQCAENLMADLLTSFGQFWKSIGGRLWSPSLDHFNILLCVWRSLQCQRRWNGGLGVLVGSFAGKAKLSAFDALRVNVDKWQWTGPANSSGQHLTTHQMLDCTS